MNESPISYKQIKWLILLIPTLAVGLWEYIRHTPVMLRYLSMEAGNWLTPVIVFLVTMLFVRRLFDYLEDMQKRLEAEKTRKMMLEEREKIARELHDGIAQSLFFLSVKLNRLENKEPILHEHTDYQKVLKTVQQMHDDVRQSIFNLRNSQSVHQLPWTESLQDLMNSLRAESGIELEFNWDIPEEKLSVKDKVELYACLRESITNIRKHSQASQAKVTGIITSTGWICTVEDNGVGFDPENIAAKGRYGLEILQDRAKEMDWRVDLLSSATGTKLEIRKELEHD
ncbi:sensor histidine kinase [Bacillus horti]|uniref:histidine kinase n=1 Tax=Caldalkalibacillus horti TaxID=77523 RepID=A0ABT9W2K7_9BACI|nr:histidine kinase [Bacillus horti]MDQ0167070.1 two-component system nitrate/nitrite sensor histidine kinase NarQ [Bacillus horti]